MLVLTLVIGGAAAPATAAERTGTRDIAVISSTRSGEEVRLYAQDTTDGGLCLDVVVAGSDERSDVTCARPPATPEGDLRPRVLTVGTSTIVYGAVSARTARLELTLYRRRAVQVRTHVAREYVGRHRDGARFYARALPAGAVIAATRALDFFGRTRAALDLNLLALPPARGRATITGLADELGRPSALVALDTRVLTDSGQRRRALCVGLRRRRLAPVPGRAVCSTSPRRVDVRYVGDCTSGRSVYYGFAPPVVRRARAVLADGSTRDMRMLRLPRRLGHRTRALLLELGAGSVRRVEALGAGGETLTTVRLAGGGC